MTDKQETNHTFARSLSNTGLGPFLRGETQTLSPGWKCQPFASRDDEIRAPGHQGDTERHEGNADGLVAPGMPGKNATGLICGGVHDGCLKGMVYPFTKPNEEAACRNCSSGRNGECLQYSDTSEQENNNTHDHDDFIPVVKRKFGEWVRVFHRRMRIGWTKGSNVRHERQTKGEAFWLSARWRG